jgi:hypothetical protein
LNELYSAAENAITTASRDAWRCFSTANDDQQWLESWLAIQCSRVPGVFAGLVVTQSLTQTGLRKEAVWPANNQQFNSALQEAAQQALHSGQGVVIDAEESEKVGLSPQEFSWFTVAMPTLLDSRPCAVVAVQVRVSSGTELEDVMRHLQ